MRPIVRNEYEEAVRLLTGLAQTDTSVAGQPPRLS